MSDELTVQELREQWSGRQFEEAVIALAKGFGWLVHHIRPALTAKGWRTPVQGHAGFPDLVLARQGRLIIAELKAGRGRLTEDEMAWMRELSLVGEHAGPAVQVVVWRPREWDAIASALEGVA